MGSFINEKRDFFFLLFHELRTKFGAMMRGRKQMWTLRKTPATLDGSDLFFPHFDPFLWVNNEWILGLEGLLGGHYVL